MKTVYVAFDTDYLVDIWKYNLAEFKEAIRAYDWTKEFSDLVRIQYDETKYNVDFDMDMEFYINFVWSDEYVNPKEIIDWSLELIYMDKEYYLQPLYYKYN